MTNTTQRDLPRELDFEDDHVEAVAPERARTAGLTGGDVPAQTVDNEGTADDLTPETLLHEEGNQRSLDVDEEAADSLLSDRPASGIGGGTGKDEAELAREPGAHDGKSVDEK